MSVNAKRRYLCGTILGASAAMLAVTPAYAYQDDATDQQPATTAPTEAQGGDSNDVLVTARRREENQQDVPVAVTAISGEGLQRQGISNVEQLRIAVPALTVAPSNFGTYTPAYSIRAQRQGDGILTQDQSVGVYFSDVVQARPNGTNQSLYDIQSVQVVKGAQGTLFGRNTTGGAVIITPNRPTDRLEGSVTGTLGNYNLWGIQGVLNLPVTEGVALRFAGLHTERDGYVYNITRDERLNDDNTTAFRVSMLIDFSPDIHNLAVFDYFRGRNNGTAHRVVAVNPLATIRLFPALLTGMQATLANQVQRDDHIVENDFDAYNRARVWGVANITTIDVGIGTIKNIFGYRDVRTLAATDWDGSAALAFHNLNDLDAHQVSDELQLLGETLDGRLNYIVGAYYFRESGHEFQPAYTLSPNLASREADVVNLSRSIFAQVDFEILPRFTITAGLRQTWDSRDLTSYNHDTAPGGPQLGRCRMFADDAGTIRLDPCVRVNPTAKFDALTYTLGANYHITPDVLVYIAHRRGYRAGGQQLRANRPSETTPFAPEIVRDYEAGFKADFLDRRVRLNIAAYRSDYEDIQRLLAPPCPAPNQNVVCSGIANAAQATVNGIEIETTIRPSEWFDFQGFYSLADAEYDTFVTPQGVDLSSKAFAGVPRSTFGFTAGVNIPGGDGVGDFRISLSYFHQGRVTLSDDNDDSVPRYGLLNLGAQWNNVLGRPVDIRLYVNNLTNKDYAPGGIGIFPSFGFESNQIGDPRNWGVSATFRF